MNCLTLFRRFAGLALAASTLPLLFAPVGRAADNPDKLELVPKYGVFDHALRSSILYGEPLQQASLTAVFKSPSGDTRAVPGFWDGGRTWRVRFSPDQAGVWSFTTACSDKSNKGLATGGKFLCGSPVGDSRFDLHGPVIVSRHGRRFEQADGTPFFWLADTLWTGAIQSRLADWDYYSQVRSRQGFTVVQWCVAPEMDGRGRRAFADSRPALPDLHFFKELDARIDLLNRAGLLSAIVPLREVALPGGVPSSTLSAQDTALEMRYMVARWGAYAVAWVLTCEGDNLGKDVDRWKTAGRQVFTGISHAPVMIYAGENAWVLDEFRAEDWVNALACRAPQDIADESLLWLFDGPASKEWLKTPERPLVVTAPYENEPAAQPGHRADASEIRRAMYWSLLNGPPAGVTYAAHDVWDRRAEEASVAADDNDTVAPWQKALFLPGAKQMATLATNFLAPDWSDLRPAPEIIAHQPGFEKPGRHIAAAATDSGSLVVIYVPEDRKVELVLDKLPKSPQVAWINPRTGERTPGVAVYGTETGGFPTPGPGDWLLVFTSSRH